MSPMLPVIMNYRYELLIKHTGQGVCVSVESCVCEMKRVITAALLYALHMWYCWPAEAQPTVLSHPFKANTWHTLDCYHDRQWNCSWELRRGDDANSFQPVELGTPLVKMGRLPGDLQIFLNETTKGTYRCTCHLEGEQRTEHRKIVYLFSQGT